MTKRRYAAGSLRRREPRDADIPQLNKLFSEAFTDRYRRDGLVGVRVPQLNPDIWRYALNDAADGAMLWFDKSGDLVAFNIAHRSGSEGWMGPLAVKVDRQDIGVGKMIVQTAIEWLRDRGATTIGLETMPRTVENIGFYGTLGFLPQHLTVTLTGPAASRASSSSFVRIGDLAPETREELLARMRLRTQQSAIGCDYTREFQLTAELGIGDGGVLQDGDVVRAFALWHSAPLADDRSVQDLRVLKVFADSEETFRALLEEIEGYAAVLGLSHVSVRCQTAFHQAYRSLVARGYRVRWTDLRMTLDGYAEPAIPDGEVLFSNWEI